MRNKAENILNRSGLNSKKIFLADSAGAFLTAFLIGVVLTGWQEFIGMPRNVLYSLALIALGFALYSACCYFFLARNWQPFLRIIAFANLTYCLLTGGLLIYFYQQLTIFGFLYFLSEIMVVCSLVFAEMKVLSLQKKVRNFPTPAEQ